MERFIKVGPAKLSQEGTTSLTMKCPINLRGHSVSSDYIRKTKTQNLREPLEKTSSSDLILKEKQLNREKDCPQQGVPAIIKITD